MITAIIGYFSLIATFIFILIGSFTSILNLIKPNPSHIQFIKKIEQNILYLLSTAIIIIIVQLLLKNFQFVYVAKTTQNNTPILLRIAALWAAQEGSILFWIWLIAIANLLLQNIYQNASIKHISINFLFKNLPIALFLIYLVFGENPFFLFWSDANNQVWRSIFNLDNWIPFIPTDGSGLNPLLHHYAMIIHPPILYLGFITMWIPTIITVSNLFSKTENKYKNEIKISSIISWIFLTIGIALGSRWAFDLLSWGGYWSWDAVETASLLPWISQTVLLHTLFNPISKTNKENKIIVLTLLTNFFITFEIFITRSGVINSVHAFARSENSILFLILLFSSFILLSISIFRYLKKYNSEHKQTRIYSKQFLFSSINTILLIYSIYLFLGLVYPIIQKIINQIEIIIDVKYYQIGTVFIWIILLVVELVYLLKSIKNQFKWASFLWFIPSFFISDQWLSRILISLALISITLWIFLFFYKRKGFKRIGNILIHISFLIISIGIVGLEYLSSEQIIPINSQSDILNNKYQIQIENVSQTQQNENTITSASLKLLNSKKEIITLTPAQTYNENTLQSINIPAQKNLILDTLSISIAGYDEEQEALLLLIQYHRFSNLLWGGVIGISAGGVLLAFGKMKGKERIKA